MANGHASRRRWSRTIVIVSPIVPTATAIGKAVATAVNASSARQLSGGP